MASKYATPSAVLRWQTNGNNQIELMTMVHATRTDSFAPIDESQTEGMKVIFEVASQFIDVTASDLGEVVPDINDRLYPSLIDYCTSRLLMDDKGEAAITKSRILKKDYQDAIYQKDGGKIRTDEVKIAVVDRRTALI